MGKRRFINHYSQFIDLNTTLWICAVSKTNSKKNSLICTRLTDVNVVKCYAISVTTKKTTNISLDSVKLINI